MATKRKPKAAKQPPASIDSQPKPWKHNPEYDTEEEDEDDMRVIRERENEPTISLEEFLRRHGR